MDNSNLNCSICMERFQVPVTIPCGHTFCQKCITMHWDVKRKSDIGPQCPICNFDFLTRPVLKQNVSLLSVLTEAANTTTCRETLTRGSEGTRAMQLCDQHKKPLIYYCKVDKMPVCCECAILQCDKHDKVLLEKERENQKMLLERKSKEVGKLIEETERGMHELSENIDHAKVTLQQTSNWVNVKFSSLIKALAEKQRATEFFLEEQKEAVVSGAEERLTEMEERIQKLRQSQSQIEALHELSDTELIKESMFVEVPCLKTVYTDVSPNLQDRLNGITDVLSRVSKLVSEDLEKAVSSAVDHDKDGSPQDKRPVLAVVPSPATPYQTGKEGLNSYRCSLTFDPHTANGHLFLSQENRRAEHLTSGPRPVPSHESRFDYTWQVLCFQGFRQGQHYWELEVSKPWAYLGVTYDTIPRKEKGKKCMVGMNELSWSLQLNDRRLSAWHNGREERLTSQTLHSRIGMLLDYEEGTLTYYGDGQTRLHAFHCAFTQELFPACWIGEGVSITLCNS
ncbi:tripartite motif-containing protein 65 isoform X2 [Synchiropus splendidus]|uniref:tripartite motif-containing protein 65 isoform X2 n=1 Tax=Synchiropus splendidus TaxID=270530 RepID=UPI00237E853B|nr:tripartite motif-containing protein 65 isoform X2 [Synchiropus splendidus]